MEKFMAEESGMVKGLATQSKKNLAREVVHLRSLVKTIKEATSMVSGDSVKFGHREAFMVMTYNRVELAEPGDDRPFQLTIWNSRDGVTPFIINIGAAKYQHVIPSMRGPRFDLPSDMAITHMWVTRTDRQVLEAWHRTMDRAVAMGKIVPEKAKEWYDDIGVAESWNYRIGLINLATGYFTDEEVLMNKNPLEQGVTCAFYKPVLDEVKQDENFGDAA